MTENELLALLAILWTLTEVTRCVLAYRKSSRTPARARQPKAGEQQ
jgi:hypothetical protein